MMARSRGCSARSGFTIVEMLVVIAVIAILVGVLLPVLSGARDAGRQLQGSNIQKQLLLGMETWSAENDLMIPGANTSGRKLADLDSADPNRVLDRGPNRPVQTFDWISPAMGAGSTLSGNRAERLFQLFSEFQDPTVEDIFVAATDGGETEMFDANDDINTFIAERGGTIEFPAPSFLMPGSWQWAGSSGAATNLILQPNMDRRLVRLPSSWFPRTSEVGAASRKVAIADGHVNLAAIAGQPRMTVEIAPDPENTGLTASTWGYGAFISSTPILAESIHYHFGGRTKVDDELLGADRSYRHRGRMNAGFFDGHVDLLARGKSAGSLLSSLDPTLWYPTGSEFDGVGAVEAARGTDALIP